MFNLVRVSALGLLRGMLRRGADPEARLGHLEKDTMRPAHRHTHTQTRTDTDTDTDEDT